MNYIIVLVFIILAVGCKIVRKTKFVSLKEIDFGTARIWNAHMELNAAD